MVPTPISEKAFSRGLLDVLIRAGLIAVLVVFCFQIFSPFLDLMLWSIIHGNHPLPVTSQVQRRAGKQGWAQRDADCADRHLHPYGACLFVGNLDCRLRGTGDKHGQK